MATEQSGPKALIEEWLPILEVSVESVRERPVGVPACPPPNMLHVWFARRPLVASRAAIAAAILGPGVDRKDFKRLLGIPPAADFEKAVRDKAKAKAEGRRTQENPFPWP